MTDNSPEATASHDSDYCETTREACQSSTRTLVNIYHKLVGNPFFPLVFWSKAAEGIITGVHPVDFTIMAAATTILWALSDAIDVEIELTGNGFFK